MRDVFMHFSLEYWVPASGNTPRFSAPVAAAFASIPKDDLYLPIV